MIEKIEDEQLQEVINYMVGPNASIGVHGISVNHANYTDENVGPKEKLVSIMTNGLNMSTFHTGLTGTIRFLDVEDCASDILDYTVYQSEDENDIIYRVICAIPEVMEDKNGEKYFLGRYDKVPQLGKDNYKVHSLPTHNISKLPKEFIVGFIAQKIGTRKSTFVANKSFYNIQDEQTKRDIEDKFLKELNVTNNYDLLPLNEEGYTKVVAMYDVFSKFGREVPNDYYYQSFLDAYGKMEKTK